MANKITVELGAEDDVFFALMDLIGQAGEEHAKELIPKILYESGSMSEAKALSMTQTLLGISQRWAVLS